MSAKNEIAVHYATAFFQVAKENTLLPELIADIDTISETIESEKFFADFLASPLFDRKSKRILLEKVLIPFVNKLTGNMLSLLVNKNRLPFLKQICLEFKLLVDADNGITQGNLVSTKPLEEMEKTEIKKKLDIRFSKNFAIKFRSDPRLLAGFKFVSNDISLDLSLATMLENLRKSMTGIKMEASS